MLDNSLIFHFVNVSGVGDVVMVIVHFKRLSYLKFCLDHVQVASRVVNPYLSISDFIREEDILVESYKEL
jgi:hypothetical protein